MNKQDLKKIIKEVLGEGGQVPSKHLGRNLNLEDPRDYREYIADKFEDLASDIRDIIIPDYPSAGYDAGGYSSYTEFTDRLVKNLEKLEILADKIKGNLRKTLL
jgi:hypothetical protein